MSEENTIEEPRTKDLSWRTMYPIVENLWKVNVHLSCLLFALTRADLDNTAFHKEIWWYHREIEALSEKIHLSIFL